MIERKRRAAQYSRRCARRRQARRERIALAVALLAVVTLVLLGVGV